MHIKKCDNRFGHRTFVNFILRNLLYFTHDNQPYTFRRSRFRLSSSVLLKDIFISYILYHTFFSFVKRLFNFFFKFLFCTFCCPFYRCYYTVFISGNFALIYDFKLFILSFGQHDKTYFISSIKVDSV